MGAVGPPLMCRKPVGDGANRVTMGLVMEDGKSREVKMASAPVQGAAAGVTVKIAKGTFAGPISWRSPRYSKNGPLQILRVRAGHHPTRRREGRPGIWTL